MDPREPSAFFLKKLFKFFYFIQHTGTGGPEGPGPFQQFFLHGFKRRDYRGHRLRSRQERFSTPPLGFGGFSLDLRNEPPRHAERTFFKIFRPHFDPQGYPFPFPFVILCARHEAVPIVNPNGNSPVFKFRGHFFRLFHGFNAFFLILENRYYYDLHRRELRRKHKSGVIGMCHDKSAYQPGTDTPACRVNELKLAVFILEFNISAPGKILSQIMAGAHLQRLAVLHQAFYGKRFQRPGEAFTLGFAAFYNRYGHYILGEIGINVKHAPGFLKGLFFGGVRGMAFLPEEFRGAQKQPRPHFPAHHISPLVYKQRQIAVTLYPVFILRPDDRFTGGTHDQRLLKF